MLALLPPFEHPLVLLAIPALAVVVAVFEWRLPGGRGRRVARFVVRTVILGLALAALAGPYESSTDTRPRRLVVAVDRDPRLPPTAATEAEAVRADAERAARSSGIATSVVDYEGDAAAGLARARFAFADDETGGVLLVTDGNAGLAGLRSAAAALRRDGVRVGAAAVPEALPAEAPEPRIVALDAPATARGPFQVRAALEGAAGPDEQLVLRVDGDVVQQLPPDAEGSAEVRFDELDLEPGLHEVGVSLQGPAGRARAHARRLVAVEAAPRVVSLLAAAERAPWRRALGAQGLQVADAEPAALGRLLTDPGALPDLVVADAGALGRLAPETALMLAERVRDGLGLLVVPGAETAAWAKLAGSPLRPVLPLVPEAEPPPPPEPDPEPPPPDPPPEIDPPEPEEGPGLKAERRPEEALPITLLLVLDRSPSMAGAKMAMAILGAQEAARALSPWDRIGVITFAHDVTLDVSPRSARGATSLPLWLSTVEAGGRGTNIAGALKLARQVLERERSPILHLILLTDGRQHPPGPIFGPIVKPMRARGITITAVGIGRGARMDQLRDIVQWAASGMVIRAATARDIPVVLTRDTRQVADRRSEQAQAIEARLRKKDDPRPPRPPEEDEPAPPPRPAQEPRETPPTEPGPAEAPARLPLRLVRPHEALTGFGDGPWPEVGAPRRTRAAPGAAVLLEREDGRAVLAAARPGLGRVLLWTLPPDDAGTLDWAPLGRLFGQAARSVMAPRGAFGYLPSLRVSHGPDGARLHVAWPRGTSTGVLEVRWRGPEGTRALGRFRAEDGDGSRPLPAAAAGALCRLEASVPEGPTLPVLSYLEQAPPQEAKRAADARALAVALDAPLLPVGRFVAGLPQVERTSRKPLWPWFVWLAVGLLPVDVFLHRRRSIT